MVNLNTFKLNSRYELEKYTLKEKKFPLYPFDVGVEIEQAYKNYEYDDESPCYPIIINPVNTGMSYTIPKSVIDRAKTFGWSEAHFDLSKPYEFKLGHHPDIRILLRRFNQIRANDIWAWHTEFDTNAAKRKGASAHFHYSIRGDLNLGGYFQNQQTSPFTFWAILWNDLILMVIFTLPFWSFGTKFRHSALYDRKWAAPVYDRLSEEQIFEIFANADDYQFRVEGIFTTRICPAHYFQAGHQYYALSWNRKDIAQSNETRKKQMTIEMRLNENHPYWFLPPLQKINLLLKKTLERCFSIKLKDHREIFKYWKSVYDKKNVYNALLDMKNIEFHPGREIPDIKGGKDQSFETGLDLFRAICTRFRNSTKSSTLKSHKIMQMYGDFIALEKVPAHLIWDVDQVYYELYEGPNQQHYQDEWLQFGSTPVLKKGKRIRKNNTVEKLLGVN